MSNRLLILVGLILISLNIITGCSGGGRFNGSKPKFSCRSRLAALLTFADVGWLCSS